MSDIMSGPSGNLNSSYHVGADILRLSLYELIILPMSNKYQNLIKQYFFHLF